jgi:outer membrane lipoprotein-sorting protein
MSRLTAFALSSLLLMACTPARGQQDAEPASATRPASPGALTDQSTIDEVLTAMQDAGKDLQSLKARILLIDIDNQTGSETKRPGSFALQRQAGQVLFRATLDGVLVQNDQGIREERIEYLLRDGVLIDRNYKKKTEARRKLPPQEGNRDLLKLGEGPFPLPIGQDVQDVHAQFQVTAVDPADEDQNELGIEPAAGTRRLRLTPLAGSALFDEFQWIEIDVKLEDGMPAKVITLDKQGGTARVTEFRTIEVNPTLPADTFDLEAINAGQWNVTVEELE